MLKFIFFLIALMCFVGEWGLLQSILFIYCFMLSLYCNHDFFLYELGFNIGMDHLSYILIFLRVWIISLVIMARTKVYFSKNYKGAFILTNIFLLLFLLLTFGSINYLFFYIIFESALIPTLILILGWGYQPERIQAGFYILFYTLFASLPLLVSILRLYWLGGRLRYGITLEVSRLGLRGAIWFFATIIAFIVKLPVYIFHLWLPKAHVEAPVAGSMILAGVLLKLGGYGLIRVLPLFRAIRKLYSWVWVGMGILGGAVVRLICFRQVDIKSLIAYSSVAHIGLVLAGLIRFRWWGINGATVVMVGHGLCSSGLFCLANIVYERLGSRSLIINKGLINFIPRLALWWFLLRIGNIGAPPSLNLLGEINLIISIVGWRKVSIFGIALLSFFRAAYTLYIYSLSQHGLFHSSLYSCCSGKVREYLVLSIHWIPLNVLILKRSLLLPGF